MRRARVALGLALAVALGALALVVARGAPPVDELSPPEAAPASPKEARVLARLALSDAELALREGRLEDARAAATQALARDPAYPDALRVLAVVEKRAGDDDEACRLMRDYVSRAETPAAAAERLLRSACGDDAAP